METDVLTFTLWVWLLPMVQGGVLRDIGEYIQCQTYTLGDLLRIDCSNLGLSELPSDLNYDAQVLDLSNNNFDSFPTQLENFSKLQTLDMSSNQLSSPLPIFMEGLSEISTVNLSNNKYTVWIGTERTFTIRRLDLSKNVIHNIDDTAFDDMSELNYLDLSENRIYELSSKLFKEVKNLETLILSKNHFSDVPPFQSSSITSLHLSSCQILYLNEDSILGMSSLLIIDLSLNQIDSIPDNFASDTLQELDLSYNDIWSLTDNTFSSLPQLAVLDLRGNNFKEVWSSSYFSSNSFLREIYLKGNRWSCESFGVNLLLTYEFLTREPSKVPDPSSLICYSPENVTQLSWQQAYIRTWHPSDADINSYTTLAVMIGIVIGVVITSFVCRSLMSGTNPAPQISVPGTTALNLNGMGTQPAEEAVVRIPLREEDLPPTYDEALLMPRLNSSFHSLPDFIDEEEDTRGYRRSRSIGDLADYRPRTRDRRSIRRTVEIRIND